MIRPFIVFIVACCTCWLTPVVAQTGYRSKLPAIVQTGFYRISLPPGFTSKTAAGFADIRLHDSKDKQVGYVLKTETPASVKNALIGFPINDRSLDTNQQHTITISNPTGKPINHLLLFTQNADATRHFMVSGSNNLQQWFIVKETSLATAYQALNDQAVQILRFPSTQYLYFRITTIGKKVLPLHIIKVGIETQQLATGSYTALPQPTVTQNDSSNGRSYVHVGWSEPQYIDRLEVEVKAAPFYRRTAAVYPVSNHQKTSYHLLHSAAKPALLVDLQTDALIIEIENGDNPPLQIERVQAGQLNRSMLAYLEKGVDYSLLVGDSSLTAPQYDLAYFADSVNNVLDTISPQAPQKLEKPVQNRSGNNSSILLWIVVISLLALLLVFTGRLTKEVGHRGRG